MTEDATPVGGGAHNGPYEVKVSLWKPSEEEGKRREEKVARGVYDEPSPAACINALLYDIRGDKSDWNLAYVDDITPAGEPDE